MRGKNFLRATAAGLCAVMALGMIGCGSDAVASTEGIAAESILSMETMETMETMPQTEETTMEETIPTPQMVIDDIVLEIGYGTWLQLQDDQMEITGPALSDAEPKEFVTEREPEIVHIHAKGLASISYTVEGGTEEDPGYVIAEEGIYFEDLDNYEIHVTGTGVDGTVIETTVLVRVVDDIPPVFTLNEEVSWTVGDDFASILMDMTSIDEIDGDVFEYIKFTDVGDVPFDPYTAGTYEFAFAALDKSGNAAESSMKVTVYEKPEATPQSISAKVNGSHYIGDSLGAGDFVVAVTMSDGTTVKNPAGWSADQLYLGSAQTNITVSYQGLTTTVTVSAAERPTGSSQGEQISGAPGDSQSGQGGSSQGSTETVTAGHMDDMAREAFAYINEYRVQHGLPELIWNDAMYEGAKIRAYELSVNYADGHTRLDGSPAVTIMDEVGVSYRGFGENTGAGYNSGKAIADGWYGSPGHQSNMLHERFTEAAVACYRDSNGKYYWCNLFIG